MRKKYLLLANLLLWSDASFADENESDRKKETRLIVKTIIANFRCSELSFYRKDDDLALKYFNNAKESGQSLFEIIHGIDENIKSSDFNSAFGTTGNLISGKNEDFLMGRIFESIKIKLKSEIYENLELKKGAGNWEENSGEIIKKANHIFEKENCMLFAYSD